MTPAWEELQLEQGMEERTVAQVRQPLFAGRGWEAALLAYRAACRTW